MPFLIINFRYYFWSMKRILISIFCAIFYFGYFQTAFCSTTEANESPYDVIFNHFHYLDKNSYDELKAANSFNIKNKKDRIKAAKLLKEILDVRYDVNSNLTKIPDNPDYIDSLTRKNIYVLYANLPEVFVEKDGNNWYYSKVTVEAIPKLHKIIFPFGTNIWAKWFSFLKDAKTLGLYSWQWIAIGIVVALFLSCVFLLRYIFRFIFYKILFKKYSEQSKNIQKLRLISNLFALWVGFLVLQIFIPTLLLNPTYSTSTIKGIDFAEALLLVIIIYLLVELFFFYTLKYVQNTDSKWDDQIVIVLQKFLKFIVIFLGIFYVLKTLDVNIATIIAGLSVTGLALALAAQDTVKNFIASVMIFIDKPFKIGDTIKTSSFEGAVQEVGFRSTRIKTADESIVYISNARLSEMTIDNKGFKIFKKYQNELSLPYNTPLAAVQLFINGIKTILFKNSFVKNSSISVFLSNINANGISVMVIFTYTIFSPKEEHVQREIILTKILELAELMQVKLFEKDTIYIQNNNVNNAPINIDEIKKQVEDFLKNIEEK